MSDLRLLQASLPIVEGEFISFVDSKIHHSICSMRYDHKYIQDKVERRLIYQIEPLSMMLGMDGVPIKYNAIREIWKTLMKLQAHDSACGCNSDKTNTIILSRLEKADQLSYSLVDYLLRKYTESLQTMDELSVLFINTLSFPCQTCCFRGSLK